MTFDSIRFDPAALRFKNFFAELNATFAEREDILAQISLALLARQHVLLAGPPGTAKSQLASAVFGRILDEQTGKPSLYSRQIGESTVRTDLVGPLNFKTLMETGRSEHFTDEGMLGAVHAFLDEVFDGRDMLLRDALNVLQERELKQGSHIVKGRIECALMTSNRYLVEVLEGSRDTLLAFVDRIAFAGFVPRGFAREDALASVLRRHVARNATGALVCPLTVQDLDVLQAACDDVIVSDAMCERLALLLARFETELREATRADPSFLPTRYLSTRTAVGAGQLLRAIVIARRVFSQPGRPLVVVADDFRDLYLHLVLCGPSMEAVELLVARERDPRERRQLQIVQTERLIFERVLASLPAIVEPPTPAPPPPTARRAAPETKGTQADYVRQLTAADPAAVLTGLAAVVAAMRAGEVNEREGRAMLERGVGTLNAHALVSTLALPRGSSASVEALAERLAQLAEDIELAMPTARHVSRWLRGRAIALLDEGSRFAPHPLGTDLADEHSNLVIEHARKRLGDLVARDTRRAHLRARGTDDDASSDAVWRETIAQTEHELLAVWDVAVCRRLTETFAQGLGEIATVLAALAPLLDELAEVEHALERLGRGVGFRSLVIGPRLARVLDATFASLVITDRSLVGGTIATAQRALDRAGLRDAVESTRWVCWAADALVDSERPQSEQLVAGSTFDHASYTNLRREDQRVSNAYALAEVALRSDSLLGREAAGPAEAHARVVAALHAIPADRRAHAVSLDVARMDRAITMLEGWWSRLQAEGADPALLVRDRFLEVAWDEGALLRFALEARTLAGLFPEDAAAAQALLARTEALHASVRTHVAGHLRDRADAAWRTSFPEAAHS